LGRHEEEQAGAPLIALHRESTHVPHATTSPPFWLEGTTPPSPKHEAPYATHWMYAVLPHNAGQSLKLNRQTPGSTCDGTWMSDASPHGSAKYVQQLGLPGSASLASTSTKTGPHAPESTTAEDDDEEHACVTAIANPPKIKEPIATTVRRVMPPCS
jgi:hypothetical protein